MAFALQVSVQDSWAIISTMFRRWRKEMFFDGVWRCCNTTHTIRTQVHIHAVLTWKLEIKANTPKRLTKCRGGRVVCEAQVQMAGPNLDAIPLLHLIVAHDSGIVRTVGFAG